MNRFLIIALFIPLLCREATAQGTNASLGDLHEGSVVHGFRATALYLDDADRPMGARFVHERTGFTLDALNIQSAPQAFIWVNSVPTSDMGEPHTQEHLLLGKGNAGRRHANLEGMSVASSSAFTQQLRTCYHFHTAAGSDVFFKLFESQMDALLHPDYTDEEIRREVCNFGVTENPADGMLRLEEKGTVYNEMVSTFERGWTRMDHALGARLYGTTHPLALVSGGLPSAIRRMQPADIRKFHADNYQLWNMGMIASFTANQSLSDILARVGDALVRLQGAAPSRPAAPLTPKLPEPMSAPTGAIVIADYPAENARQPGPVLFAWPPKLRLDAREKLLLDLFVENIAGDPTTNLYGLLIDPATRKIDLGATSVFGWVSSDQGNSTVIGLGDVMPNAMTEETLTGVRRIILDEINHIASLPDGDEELKAFNARVASRIVERRRSLRDFVNAPPGFGYRGTGSGWMSLLDDLAKREGFSKQLTMKDELAAVEKMLAGEVNVWRAMNTIWRLNQSTPYIGAARPSPELIAIEDRERKDRIATELKRLSRLYKITDDQEVIRRYRRDYDANTVELDSLARLAPAAPFIDSPPFTLDDQITYEEEQLGNRARIVSSTFDNLTGATVGVAFNLENTVSRHLVYLSMLPTLMTGSGVIDAGRPISYKEMNERLRNEVRELTAYYSVNYATNRCELVVRGSGADPEEARKALDWMELAMRHADWRPENLPRLRELVDQTLAGLRSTMQGSEESWVQDPAMAYWRQHDELLLATTTFMTQTHNVHRMRWLLKDAGDQRNRDAISAFLSRLADAGGAGRANLSALLRAIQEKKSTVADGSLNEHLVAAATLPPVAADLAVEAARDLELTLNDIPDESLRSDWRYLCRQIRADLLVPPSQALAGLDSLRDNLFTEEQARFFMISSAATRNALRAELLALTDSLDGPRALSAATPHAPNGIVPPGIIEKRVMERTAAAKPLFVGLVNPNTQGGVFVHSAPGPGYQDTDRESLLRFLASKLYSGHGAHSMFMKTWSAGLAYSNGLRISPGYSQIGYYAERCPELPQTLRFVIDELKKSPRDPAYVDYAIAQAFGEFRSASRYESRGEAIAADLADGLTPETVRAFRRAILDLRNDPRLVDDVFDRMESVYGSVLPGYGPRSADVPGGVFMVIGPERQLSLYEDYLKTVEGTEAKLYRLYPRDFWITSPTAAIEQ